MDALLTNANCELLLSMRFPLFFRFFVEVFCDIHVYQETKQAKHKVDFFFGCFCLNIPIRLFVECFLFTPFSVCRNCGSLFRLFEYFMKAKRDLISLFYFVQIQIFWLIALISFFNTEFPFPFHVLYIVLLLV